MSSFRFATEKKTDEGVGLDLDILLRTRLLIQANSGGGKSFLIRKLLEVTHGKVQQIVLDIEGEFSTLREKYDYLLIGKDGEIQTDVRSADLLARKLLELNVSAIIDLYELKQHERVLFVKRFLDAMTNARKELWHPCLVVVDEAHQFAPQASKSESVSAVIDMATRGRKRGFCLVAATQRISKLHKDVAAECNNKLIGRASLDVDMKRAGEEIGFTEKEEMHSLRSLNAGEFFAFGPALSPIVRLVQVDKVKTQHPEAGMGKAVHVSPTPKAIEKLMSELADLPQKAEKESMTVQELHAEIRSLKHSLASQKKNALPDEASIARIGVFQEAARLKELQVKQLYSHIRLLSDKIEKIYELSSNTPSILMAEPSGVKMHSFQAKPLRDDTLLSVYPATEGGKDGKKLSLSVDVDEMMFGKKLRSGAMKILENVVRYHPTPISVEQAGVLSGFTSSGGTFQAYIADLKRECYLLQHSGMLEATPAGIHAIGAVSPLPQSSEELFSFWSSKFRAGAGKILRVAFDSYPHEVSFDSVSELTGFSWTGGTFQAYVSDLRRAGLVEVGSRRLKATKWLFPEGGSK